MNIIRIILITLSLAVSFGCASHKDVRVAKEEAIQAAADSNRTAEEALATAREAKLLAQDANTRSQRNEEMLNRGFKRSMYK